MRYFYALLLILVAILITVKPEYFRELVAVSLAVAGLLALLPTE